MTGKMKPEVMAAIKDARSLIADARAEVKKLLPRLDPMLKKVEAAVDNVQTASANIVTASADVKRTTAEVKEMVLANRPHIDGMLEESHQAAARLNLGMEDIRRNPWKLLTRNIEADAYTQNIYDATMRFAEGAHSLSVASETLHALQAQPGASDEALARAKKHVKALAEKMPQLEAALFEALQKRPR